MKLAVIADSGEVHTVTEELERYFRKCTADDVTPEMDSNPNDPAWDRFFEDEHDVSIRCPLCGYWKDYPVGCGDPHCPFGYAPPTTEENLDMSRSRNDYGRIKVTLDFVRPMGVEPIRVEVSDEPEPTMQYDSLERAREELRGLHSALCVALLDKALTGQLATALALLEEI
jgi:hypothetical protein